jgi:hypothetical protein
MLITNDKVNQLTKRELVNIADGPLATKREQQCNIADGPLTTKREWQCKPKLTKKGPLHQPYITESAMIIRTQEANSPRGSNAGSLTIGKGTNPGTELTKKKNLDQGHPNQDTGLTLEATTAASSPR